MKHSDHRASSLRRIAISVPALVLMVVFASAIPQPACAQDTAGSATGNPQAKAMPRVALVLSGGSAFGMAHVGVIKVLEEAGIPIDMIMGTSMGSIVSGLYAAGYTPAEMAKIVTTIDWNSVFLDRKLSAGDRYDFQKRAGYVGRFGFDDSGLVIGEGLFSGQNVLALFSELTLHQLGTRRFDDLPVPYRAVAADIWNGDKVVFSGGSMAEAMRSSMSIPGLFRPYQVGGRTVVDGGIVDNLPVDLARTMGADIIIAVESRGASPKSPDSLTSALAIAGQTFDLFISQNMKPNRELADLLIVPDLAAYSTASYGEAAAIIAAGEKKARQMLPDIRKIADRIKATRPLVTPAGQPNRAAMGQPPLVSRIRVEGAPSASRAGVEAAFSRFKGKVPDRETLREAVDTVFATGDYDLVKFDLEPLGDKDVTLVISCTPTARPKNAVLVNYDLDGIISNGTSIDSELTAGFMLRSLTTRTSALFGKVSLGNGFSGYAEFFQPFGPFFAMPWARYSLDYDEWILDELKISTLYRNYGGGLWMGLAIGRHTDLRAGLSFEIVKDASKASPKDERMAAARAALRIDTRSSTVFPDRGLALLAYGVWSDGTILGEIPYAKVELDFEANIPLGNSFTLGFSGYGGTDFSGFIDGAEPVSSALYFNLARQGLFYGLAPQDPYSQGNTVAGVGLELRRKVGKLNPILGGDIYLFANGSLGTAQQTVDPGDYTFFPLRWSATLGAGLKLSDELGCFAGAGAVGVGNKIRPAITLSFGSFEERLEDRR